MGAVWGFVYVSALRAGEACAGAVSGLLSADAHSPDGRLEGDDSAGGGCASGVYGSDFEGAGLGDRYGLYGGDGADALSGWGADEVLRNWRGVCGACALLPLVPRGVSP